MKKNDVYLVFASRFNKDDMYKKIYNKLTKRKRKQMIMKYSFASIIVIFVVSGVLITKNMFDKEENPNTLDEVKNEIYINEIDNVMYDGVSNLDVRVFDTNNSTYAVMPISVQIPSDLKLDTIYIVYIKDKQTGEYDIIHDIIESYTGKNRTVNVAYSSIGEVLRDIDIPKGNLSIVEGIKVMISKNGKTFIGQFKYHDVYYDIESFGLTIDEFLNIIKSIIG